MLFTLQKRATDSKRQAQLLFDEAVRFSPDRLRLYSGLYAAPLAHRRPAGRGLFYRRGRFGLPMGANTLLAIPVLLPAAVLFIGIGLLLGSLFTNKQVGGIASILINAAAWLSGTWFDLELVGGAFASLCNALPFAPCGGCGKSGHGG